MYIINYIISLSNKINYIISFCTNQKMKKTNPNCNSDFIFLYYRELYQFSDLYIEPNTFFIIPFIRRQLKSEKSTLETLKLEHRFSKQKKEKLRAMKLIHWIPKFWVWRTSRKLRLMVKHWKWEKMCFNQRVKNGLERKVLGCKEEWVIQWRGNWWEKIRRNIIIKFWII